MRRNRFYTEIAAEAALQKFHALIGGALAAAVLLLVYSWVR